MRRKLPLVREASPPALGEAGFGEGALGHAPQDREAGEHGQHGSHTRDFDHRELLRAATIEGSMVEHDRGATLPSARCWRSLLPQRLPSPRLLRLRGGILETILVQKTFPRRRGLWTFGLRRVLAGISLERNRAARRVDLAPVPVRERVRDEIEALPRGERLTSAFVGQVRRELAGLELV